MPPQMVPARARMKVKIEKVSAQDDPQPRGEHMPQKRGTETPKKPKAPATERRTQAAVASPPT